MAVARQEDDRALPKEALQILTRLGHKEHHYTLHWWTHHRREETSYTYQELKKAREKVERYLASLPRGEQAESKEKIRRWLSEQLDAELRLIESMFGVLKSAYTGNPTYEQVITGWDERISEADIYARMKAAEKQLEAILKAPRIEEIPEAAEEETMTAGEPASSRTFNRRQALRMLGIAATAALSAATLAKLVKDQPLSTEDYARIEDAASHETPVKHDPLRELPAPGFHLQLSAYADRKTAIAQSEQVNQWLPLQDLKNLSLHTRVYLPSRHFRPADDPAKHKVISVEAFPDEATAVATAEQAFTNKNMDIEQVGIIHIDGQGRISWAKLKTLKRYLHQKYHLPSRGLAITPTNLAWFLRVIGQALPTYEELYRVKVDERLIWAIMLEESHFDTAAHSKAGAMGLMQLMPAMWLRFHGISRLFPHKREGRVPYEEPILHEGQLEREGAHRADTCDPGDYRMNIDAGVQMLCYLHRKYWKESERTKRVIAAYNAGETLINKGIYPKETRAYLGKVSNTYNYFREEEQRRKRPRMTEEERIEIRLEATFNRLGYSQAA